MSDHLHYVLRWASPALREEIAAVLADVAMGPGQRLATVMSYVDAAVTVANARIQVVQKLHVKCRDERCGVTLDWCHACEVAWPCPTIRALNAEPHRAEEADVKWTHARLFFRDKARPDLTRQYVQPETGRTEAPCLNCGEVVMRVEEAPPVLCPRCGTATGTNHEYGCHPAMAAATEQEDSND